jgi:ABC-type multidrug transport system ATPase subunit
MLRIVNLRKEYHGRAVVDDLNLHISPGEIYGFLGPNGAGKSTTIEMILGLIAPTRGSIRLFGKTLAEDYFNIKRRIGVVGEEQHLYGEMTGYEYLAFFAGLFGVAHSRRRIGDWLERLNLSAYGRLPLRAYSKGMQQKIGLARALLHEPDLVILDEPVSALDPQGIKQARDIILEENRAGKSFLISSHLLSEIERTCHRVCIMHHGQMLAEDTVPAIRNRLATGYEIQVELESPVAGLREGLETLPFVKDVKAEGLTLRIDINGDQDYRSQISRFIADRSGLIVSLTRSEPSLEDLFITLTESNISLVTGRAVKQ